MTYQNISMDMAGIEVLVGVDLYNSIEYLPLKKNSWVLVVHTCNPSC
jgi:hypothetical protein